MSTWQASPAGLHVVVETVRATARVQARCQRRVTRELNRASNRTVGGVRPEPAVLQRAGPSPELCRPHYCTGRGGNVALPVFRCASYALFRIRRAFRAPPQRNNSMLSELEQFVPPNPTSQDNAVVATVARVKLTADRVLAVGWKFRRP